MGTRSMLLSVGLLLLLSSCQPAPSPDPPVAPPPEDLSEWTVPALVQPEEHKPRPELLRLAPRPATEAEKLYDYVPGGVYKVTVALDAPLDIVLEPGEKVQTAIGSDPKPIEQGSEGQQKKERWEYKEGVEGAGEHAIPHIFLRALEPGATLGFTVTTSRRVYYLACQSVAKSQIRAVRWKYPATSPVLAEQEDKTPRLLPSSAERKLYHVGYQLRTSSPTPAWTPRFVVDDGKKLYIGYPEVTLFGTVPLVRVLGPNGPQVINTLQFLNVVIIDLLAPKVELRVGLGERAEIVTITRGQLRTIECPQDNDCPRWPTAAQRLAGRER